MYKIRYLCICVSSGGVCKITNVHSSWLDVTLMNSRVTDVLSLLDAFVAVRLFICNYILSLTFLLRMTWLFERKCFASYLAFELLLSSTCFCRQT